MLRLVIKALLETEDTIVQVNQIQKVAKEVEEKVVFLVMVWQHKFLTLLE
jgi:hypothetical protein